MCICGVMGKKNRTDFLPFRSLHSRDRGNNSNIHITYMAYYDISNSLRLHQEDRKDRACCFTLGKAY